ncbi:hypothetical protein J2S34_002500 [Nitrobacter winogradskyi]|uniref:Uncharacterized protein n=1 Tax=Nitrobacter winogradskyi TaxID=913 RepID=A0ACC6ALH8_NITWI|nr:hypothetical protein [Nitrobacter winogradskyi]
MFLILREFLRRTGFLSRSRAGENVLFEKRQADGRLYAVAASHGQADLKQPNRKRRFDYAGFGRPVWWISRGRPLSSIAT